LVGAEGENKKSRRHPMEINKERLRMEYPYAQVLSMLSAPQITLYHGTTTPEDVIRTRGPRRK